MKFYNYMKVNGEMACRNLSEKAQEVYNLTDQLVVYEYESANGDKLYALDGAFGEVYNLTFSELEEFLEDIVDELPQ